MLLKIYPTSDTPIYQQICNQLILGIAEGELLPGENLPSVRQLADEIGVNMMTVAKAYTELKNDGYIITDRRNGTKVANKQLPDPLFKEQFDDSLRLLLAKGILHQFEEEYIQSQINSIFQKFNK